MEKETEQRRKLFFQKCEVCNGMKYIFKEKTQVPGRPCPNQECIDGYVQRLERRKSNLERKGGN